MRFTRIRDLLVAGVVTGLLVHLLLRVAYGSLPPLPRLAGVTLLVIALVDLVLAFVLRARIQRKPGSEPVDPITAARAVALAKASSVLGAVMLGAWAGVLIYVLPSTGDLDAASNDLVSAVVGMVCALALIGAGLWLEHCCRTPRDPHETR
ncbi:DUF3180 domain-containing protein [Umezawaea beigongshangensis]|uniref:DUF3180 domain-containing protein n=1 Tax=Umezawaea beigongshangensis TaxID=2780383 RepID=UPI0018F23045|nr:DUF3180 domain-containing protein [Umezawaea beigongshangensis]